MSVSSTGTVLSYTDITTRVPLPSIQANANKYLKVRNDGQNLEWAEVEIGGGLELILDERTVSNPPSVCFEDALGTKYNTGINMYRDNVNANNQTISLYANNVKQVDVASNRTIFHNNTRHIDGAQNLPGVCFKDNPSCGLYRPALDTIGMVANNKRLMDVGINQVEIGKTGAGNDVNLVVNGLISTNPITLTTDSYSWNNFTNGSYNLDTSGGNVVINLQFAGSENIGSPIRFYKNSTSNQVQFFASGGTVRLNGMYGTQAVANAVQFTSVPTGASNFWLFEITRERTDHYVIETIDYTNGTNVFTHADRVLCIGSTQSSTAPAISFSTSTNSGFSGDNVNNIFMINNGVTTMQAAISGIFIGTPANRRPLIVRGHYVNEVVNLSGNATYNWTTTFATNANGLYTLDSTSGNITIELPDTGTATNDRTTRFIKNVDANSILFTSVGAVRLNTPWQSQAVSTGTFNFSFPANTRCTFDITRITTSIYNLNIINYFDATNNRYISGTDVNYARLGSVSNPSYSFQGDIDTGFYSSGADTLDFSAGGTRVASVDTSGFSVVSGALKPTRRIQYTPSGVQTASFTISTLLQHLIRTDPGSTNDLVVTLDNVGTGTHYVITKETSTRALQVTASGSITYNGSNRNAVNIIASGSRGIWKIWQVSATDWYGEASTF